MRLHVAYMFVVQDNDLEEFVMQGEFDLDDVDGLEEKTNEESDKPCCCLTLPHCRLTLPSLFYLGVRQHDGSDRV